MPTFSLYFFDITPSHFVAHLMGYGNIHEKIQQFCFTAVIAPGKLYFE
jgi:hypothetical protein